MPWKSPIEAKAVAIGISLAAVVVFVAACGGASGPGVASLGTRPTTTTIPETSQTASPTDYAKDLAYAQCMRTKGIPSFPDPNAQGDFALNAKGPNPQSSKLFQQANSACQHLLPNGGRQSAAQTAEALKYALKGSACMRAHGVPNFPDPRSVAGGFVIQFGGRGLNPNGSAVRKAMRECQHWFNAMAAVP